MRWLVSPVGFGQPPGKPIGEPLRVAAGACPPNS
jgi:hypothetical protein